MIIWIATKEFNIIFVVAKSSRASKLIRSLALANVSLHKSTIWQALYMNVVYRITERGTPQLFIKNTA